jgi:hypothetical protein
LDEPKIIGIVKLKEDEKSGVRSMHVGDVKCTGYKILSQNLKAIG